MSTEQNKTFAFRYPQHVSAARHDPADGIGQLVHASYISLALAMILFGSIHYVGVGLIATIGLMFWALIPLIYVLRTQKLIPVILAHYINDFLTFAIFIPLTFHPR